MSDVHQGEGDGLDRASPFRTRSVHAALLGVSLLLGVGSVAAQESDSATVADDRSRTVWTAVALERLLFENDYPSVLLLSALGQAAEQRGPRALDGMDGALAGVLDRGNGFGAPISGAGRALQGCREEDDLVEGTVCSMERLVPLVPSELARDITDLGSRLVARSSPGRSMLAPLGVTGSVSPASSDPLQSFAAEALERVWMVGARPDVANGFDRSLDRVVGDVVGIAPRLGPAEALAFAPQLRQLLEAHPVVSSSLDFPRPVGSVREEYSSFLQDVTGSYGGLLSGALGIAGGDEPAPLPALQPGDTESARRWAAGRSFVYLASRSAELAGAGPQVADRMRALGTATVDLQNGVASFPTSLARMGRDLAVAALTGNVLGAASRITSFLRLTGGEMSAEDAEDLRAVREGVESIRHELAVGFDSIDHRVDELLGVVDARFTRLERLAESNDRDVREELNAIHEDIFGLTERLDWMSATVTSLVQAGFDRDYGRTMVRCMEHRERYVQPFDEMDFATFSQCLADFRARAVVDATDALLTDRSTPLDDVSLVTALSDDSFTNLTYRLPLLARVSQMRFGYPLTSGRGPANILEWAVASESYVTLLDDWPAHARAIAPYDLESMRAVGLELQGALQRVAGSGAGNGAPLLDGVLGYYETRLHELTAEADSLARRHRQETLASVQPAALLTAMHDEEGLRRSLDTPPFLRADVPSAVRMAGALGLDDVNLTYRIESEDSVVRGNPRHKFLFFGRRHDRWTYTRTHVRVELRSALHGTIRSYHAHGPYVLRLTDEMDGDERSNRVSKSVRHFVDGDEHFRAVVWPTLSADASAWSDEPADPDALNDLQGRIDAEVALHATAGLNAVFAFACSDGPGDGSMSRADRLSAERVRTALVGMSAARVLLEAYLRLAIPDALDTDADLREALVGSESIIDRSTVCGIVAAGGSPLATLWMDEEPSRRLESARVVLQRILSERDLTAQAPTWVDSTLERLDTAIRVQRLRASVAVSN